MSDYPRMSPLQFLHLADGSVQIVGRPYVTIKVHEDQAHTGVPEWERQLGLPKFQEEWEALSIDRGFSDRFVRFVLCDQSRTKHVGNYPLQPARIRIQPGSYLFTLGHSGFEIGRCPVVKLHPKEMTRVFLHLPNFVDGDCLIGEAQLYDSPLPAFATQPDVQAEIAKARAGLGQLPQPHAKRGIVPPMVSVIPRRPMQPQQPTRSPHADREVSGDGPHQRAFARGRQAFFARTSCRMTLSKVRSATSCLSLLFSSSSCRNRRISAMAIWP